MSRTILTRKLPEGIDHFSHKDFYWCGNNHHKGTHWVLKTRVTDRDRPKCPDCGGRLSYQVKTAKFKTEETLAMRY